MTASDVNTDYRDKFIKEFTTLRIINSKLCAQLFNPFLTTYMAVCSFTLFSLSIYKNSSWHPASQYGLCESWPDYTVVCLSIIYMLFHYSNTTLVSGCRVWSAALQYSLYGDVTLVPGPEKSLVPGLEKSFVPGLEKNFYINHTLIDPSPFQGLKPVWQCIRLKQFIHNLPGDSWANQQKIC